jgi:hypothetical protein
MCPHPSLEVTQDPELLRRPLRAKDRMDAAAAANDEPGRADLAGRYRTWVEHLAMRSRRGIACFNPASSVGHS